MRDDDDQRGDHVEHTHERHDARGDPADAPNPADYDHRYHRGQTDSHHPVVGFESRRHRAENLQGLVGLEHVADTQTAHDGQKRKQHREGAPGGVQPLFPQAVLQIIHGSAGDVAVRVHLAVHHRQGARCELGGHAENGRDEHPEDGTRSTDTDSDGHPGYVAQTHGCRERTGQRLEMGDLSGIVRFVVVSAKNVDRMFEPADRHPAEVEAVVDAAAQ